MLLLTAFSAQMEKGECYFLGTIHFLSRLKSLKLHQKVVAQLFENLFNKMASLPVPVNVLSTFFHLPDRPKDFLPLPKLTFCLDSNIFVSLPSHPCGSFFLSIILRCRFAAPHSRTTSQFNLHKISILFIL